MHKVILIMDLIFRGMSRAAGVEIPPGTHLPWEGRLEHRENLAGPARQIDLRFSRRMRRLAGKAMSFLGSRLVRAGAQLAS